LEVSALSSLIITDRQKDLVFYKINRPDKRNSLNQELVREFKENLDSIYYDNSIKVVVITGIGKAFCAGADLAYLEKLSHFSDSENLEDSQDLSDLFKKIYEMPKLTIAMVNGPAIAGGCGLALTCDFIFADKENAKFGFSEVRIGFIPAIVMNFLIRKVSLNNAYKLVIGAEIIQPEEAFQLGFVDEIMESDKLNNYTFNFIDNILTQNSFAAMMQTKKLFQRLLDIPLSDGIQIASEINAQSRKSADCQTGLKSFLNKQKVDWRKSK